LKRKTKGGIATIPAITLKEFKKNHQSFEKKSSNDLETSDQPEVEYPNSTTHLTSPTNIPSRRPSSSQPLNLLMDPINNNNNNNNNNHNPISPATADISMKSKSNDVLLSVKNNSNAMAIVGNGSSPQPSRIIIKKSNPSPSQNQNQKLGMMLPPLPGNSVDLNQNIHVVPVTNLDEFINTIPRLNNFSRPINPIGHAYGIINESNENNHSPKPLKSKAKKQSQSK